MSKWMVKWMMKKKLSDSKSWSKVDVFGVSTPNTVLVLVDFVRGAHPKNFKIFNQTAPFDLGHPQTSKPKINRHIL